MDKTDPATQLEADDLGDMGQLLCYLKSGDIGRMTKDAMERILGDMQSCPLTPEQGKKLNERYTQLFP